jgi:hypothetical protein
MSFVGNATLDLRYWLTTPNVDVVGGRCSTSRNCNFWHTRTVGGTLLRSVGLSFYPVNSLSVHLMRHCGRCDLAILHMPTEPAEQTDFVTSWLAKAKADATLNREMVVLLADHHEKGTSTDANILKSVLKLTVTPEASNDVH